MRGIKVEVPLQQQIKFLTGRLCFSVVCLLTILPANAEAQARKGLPASAALAPNGVLKDTAAHNASFLAQITPDGTLPTVVEEQENMEKITGGEREGNNLFHSFEEFSIPEGIEAIFENSLDVENIFTRITGESASTINGILKTQGSANFFLVNPNGIVFGENAQLDVGGSIIATTFAEGNGGNINLSTSELRLNNAGITSSTFGDGDGGLLNVNADLIEIAGSTATDRASIATTSFASGNVGNLTLNTTQLRVIDGASLSSSSFAFGDAGNLTINASESIEVSGRTNNSITSSNPQSIIRSAIQSATPQGRKALGLPEVPSGNGGNLVINTPLLNVSQEGIISVENQGTGDAGTLTIIADNLTLEEAGKITAATTSGTGGNINLSTQNLEIGAGSKITATAENNGDGGNININTSNLIAKKNSEVTANAFAGGGGNIDINAEGLFLFDSPDNIFSASSELGIDGEVNINTTIDFSSFEPISPEFLVAEEALQGSCFARRNSRQGSFVYGGAGGLPVSPSSAIDEESSLSSQLPEVQPNSQTSRSSDLGGEDNSAAAETVIYSAQTPQKWQVGEPIIEPTNLIKTADGRLLWVRKQMDDALSLICQ
jgi:filamentous hemagglutinin family protein